MKLLVAIVPATPVMSTRRSPRAGDKADHERAIELDPKYASAYMNRAEVYRKNGEELRRWRACRLRQGHRARAERRIRVWPPRFSP